MTPVISWMTHKTATGYEYQVAGYEYQKPTEIILSGTATSRAIATRLARQWTTYFKRLQAKGLPLAAPTKNQPTRFELSAYPPYQTPPRRE